MRTLSAVTIFFKWMKGFYWGKIFDSPAYFVVQLGQTVYAVAGFSVMLLICILAFTNFFLVIQKNKKETEIQFDEIQEKDINVDIAPYVTDYIGTIFGELGAEIFNAFISMYLLSLGEFGELDGYMEGHDR
jgi:energy-converting hydrogenase Eha subunit H